MDRLPAEVRASLAGLGLIAPDENPPAASLAGGVSSDIWRVDLPSGPVAVKRALARLKVAADWQAPVGRNAYEVAWIRTAGAIVPRAVPPLLGHDPKAGLFVMAYLSPEDHTLWKDELRRGNAEPPIAADVGSRLGRIHAGTAGDAAVAAKFATDAIFGAIRLEPYLEAAARVHPDRAGPLIELVASTAAIRRVLVHGDISPKNIVVGPEGPVFLDAECAWYGDPAFDLAFCLNHLLLKCLWVPEARDGFLACYAALSGAYLSRVAWEPQPDLERRAARLLAGLMLARVDGKSPVEYLTAESDKNKVREFARAQLARPADSVAAVAAAWAMELAR